MYEDSPTRRQPVHHTRYSDFLNQFVRDGRCPEPTTKAFLPEDAKIWRPEERLATCEDITGTVDDDERRAEPEPQMEDGKEKVDTKDSNANIPDTEDAEAEETTDELGAGGGGEAALLAGAMWFSARSAATKAGNEFCSARATADAISLEEETAGEAGETVAEFPAETGGVNDETGNKPADKLLKVERGVP